MSDNWIVQNLNSALNTWNEKLAEIWTLLTQSPESFKGGTIWSVITGINGALTAIGYGLLVLFFAAGIVKTCGSFTDMKKPEHALKAFIRFALAQGAIMYGMELMTALFSIVQGIVSTIMAQSGMANGGVTELPAEIVEKIEAVGMLESIPLWIVTLLGSLLITVLSFIMILTVYSPALLDTRKMTKVPAIKTGTRLNLQRKKQHKFRSFSRQTFNCYVSTHLFYKLMDNRKTKTASFFRPSFVTLIELSLIHI